jgi:hypothetical protein
VRRATRGGSPFLFALVGRLLYSCDMTPAALLSRLGDRPFRPFRVHMSDGTVLEVTQPGMFIVGETSAVLPTMWGTDEGGQPVPKRWRTLALDHMTQFSDVEGSNGKRRTRR